MKSIGEAAGGQDDTYGFALEAHPGKSRGRPTTNTRSRRNVYERPASLRLLPDAPHPGRSHRTHRPGRRSQPGAGRGTQRHLAPFIPDTNATEALNRQLRKAIKSKGHFPSEDAARKLIYLAVTNAAPAWTRTRSWTVALLAFKIHFGDRVPDTAS
jgi:hypothetical protein